MTTGAALELVLRLARKQLDDNRESYNIIALNEQVEACDIVEDLIVNEYGDD